MNRGGSRWSIAIGALFGLSMLLPAAVHASTPLTLTLTVSSTSAYVDAGITLTVQTSPVVAGLPIGFADQSGKYTDESTVTDQSGSTSVTFVGRDNLPWGTYSVYATSQAEDGYDAATSNVVQVNLIRHPSILTLITYGAANTILPIALYARVAAPTCDGYIDLTTFQAGVVTSFPAIGRATELDTTGVVGCGVDFSVSKQALGTSEFQALYYNSPLNDDAASAILDVPVTLLATNTTLVASANPVEAGQTTTLTATISSPGACCYVEGTGAITFYDGTTSLGTIALTGGSTGSTAVLPVRFKTPGLHVLTASWGGTAIGSPSTSLPVELTVTPNQVDASGVGVGASTFYPVVDGYGDQLVIQGTLGETATVDITISNATTGDVERAFELPDRGAGYYNVNWDGMALSTAPTGANGRSRSAPGPTMVPAGLYHVTQVITDDLGARMTVTSNVTVSLKKLAWYTGSTTYNGNHLTAKGGNQGTDSGSPTYAGGERVTMLQGTPGFYNALGYQFTLPSAVEYSAISFSVLGSGTNHPQIGLQNRQLGTWAAGKPWVIDYFSPLSAISTKYAWSTVSGSPTDSRIGRTVRGIVLALDWTSGGHYDVAKVKLTYRYALLK